MFSRWKLAQIMLQLAPESALDPAPLSGAGFQRRFPALVSSASFRQVCHGHNCYKSFIYHALLKYQ